MKPLFFAAIAITTLIAIPQASAGHTPYVCEPFEQPAGLDLGDSRSAQIDGLKRILDGSPTTREVTSALFGWVVSDPNRFTDAQRIAIQSRLFRIGRRYSATAHRAAATVAMRAFALPPARVAKFESSHPIGLESVLGSRSRWVERATDNCGSGPLIHERVAGGGLSFRPIRSGETHALVSQMVHIDSEGAPHITGLIEDVELRVGRDRDATACVLGVDSSSLAGARLRLAPRPIAELPHSIFMRRNGNGLSCVSCHDDDRSQGARDLSEASERAEVMGERDRLLIEYAARRWRGMQI